MLPPVPLPLRVFAGLLLARLKSVKVAPEYRSTTSALPKGAKLIEIKLHSRHVVHHSGFLIFIIWGIPSRQIQQGLKAGDASRNGIGRDVTHLDGMQAGVKNLTSFDPVAGCVARAIVGVFPCEARAGSCCWRWLRL